MELATKEIVAFQKKILDWYEKNQRSLPWRENRDPYRILISEVMLQQTQVNRVIDKYHEWMTRFPTMTSLAEASTRDVLLYWSGLGYNRRALYLQKLAQVIVSDYQGKFPEDEKLLRKLPGIGPYTARALLCFGFDHQIAVVDTNIKKVILLEFPGCHVVTEAAFQTIADQLLPQGKAYAWNQALMDYASAELRSLPHPRVAKQKPFKDSDRFYRGEIIRLLLKEHALPTESLYTLLTKRSTLDKSRYDHIVTRLLSEGILVQKNDRYLLG